MMLQDVTDIKRVVMSFLGMKELYKAVLILKPTPQDLGFYLSSQDVSVHSKAQWDRLFGICGTYGKVKSLSFHFEPEKLGFSLARSVDASFHWKRYGIIRALEFIVAHRECDRITIRLVVGRDRPWNFGVLCNVLKYPKNLSLKVEGSFPIYTEEVYINTPCRMSDLEISAAGTIDPVVLQKIQRLTDHLKISVL